MILDIWHHAQERIQNFETDDLLRLAWGLPEGSFSTVLVQVGQLNLAQVAPVLTFCFNLLPSSLPCARNVQLIY